MRNGRRSVAILASASLLSLLLLPLAGCGGKQEEKSASSGSGGYYDGPMKPKSTAGSKEKGGDSGP